MVSSFLKKSKSRCVLYKKKFVVELIYVARRVSKILATLLLQGIKAHIYHSSHERKQGQPKCSSCTNSFDRHTTIFFFTLTISQKGKTNQQS